MAGGSTRTQTMSRSCVDTQVENVRESATGSIYRFEVPADLGDLCLSPQGINPTSTERPVDVFHLNNRWQIVPTSINSGWWFGTFFILPYILGISSSQLIFTNSDFSGSVGQPPTRTRLGHGNGCIACRQLIINLEPCRGVVYLFVWRLTSVTPVVTTWSCAAAVLSLVLCPWSFGDLKNSDPEMKKIPDTRGFKLTIESTVPQFGNMGMPTLALLIEVRKPRYGRLADATQTHIAWSLGKHWNV